MRVFGIDPGTARLGCGVIDFDTSKKYERISLVHHEVLQTSPGIDVHKRLKYLYDKLNHLMSKYDPECVVIEKLFFNTNVKTAIAVGQARGVCLLAAANNKLPFYEYTALQAKKELTGFGRSDKKVMQKTVRELLNLDNIIKSDDANDAVAMALCHVFKELQPQSLAGFVVE